MQICYNAKKINADSLIQHTKGGKMDLISLLKQNNIAITDLRLEILDILCKAGRQTKRLFIAIWSFFAKGASLQKVMSSAKATTNQPTRQRRTLSAMSATKSRILQCQKSPKRKSKASSHTAFATNVSKVESDMNR